MKPTYKRLIEEAGRLRGRPLYHPYPGSAEKATALAQALFDALHLVSDHSGPCEIGSLFLHPDERKKGWGRLLSCCRFLFMAEFSDPFEDTVIAEMRGVVDVQGRSSFWEALGRRIFDIDFPKADYLSMKNKKFIADLMPKHPIYTMLLPEEAQSSLGGSMSERNQH